MAEPTPLNKYARQHGFIFSRGDKRFVKPPPSLVSKKMHFWTELFDTWGDFGQNNWRLRPDSNPNCGKVHWVNMLVKRCGKKRYHHSRSWSTLKHGKHHIIIPCLPNTLWGFFGKKDTWQPKSIQQFVSQTPHSPVAIWKSSWCSSRPTRGFLTMPPLPHLTSSSLPTWCLLR